MKTILKTNTTDTNNSGEIIIYKSADGEPSIEVRVENETVWLTQERIAELFGVKRPAITKHLKNIFESGELLEKETMDVAEIRRLLDLPSPEHETEATEAKPSQPDTPKPSINITA